MDHVEFLTATTTRPRTSTQNMGGLITTHNTQNNVAKYMFLLGVAVRGHSEQRTHNNTPVPLGDRCYGLGVEEGRCAAR